MKQSMALSSSQSHLCMIFLPKLLTLFSSQQALMPELTVGQCVLGCEKRKNGCVIFF